MKSNLKQPTDRKLLDEIRTHGKLWRRLVAQCARAGDLIPSAIDEQYQAVHSRILAACRGLAGEESLPESRRRAALQLEELLRPWSTTQSIAEAPAQLVDDLVNKMTTLQARLQGKRRNSAWRRVKKLVITACVAGMAGVFTVLYLQWSSSDASRPLFQSLSSILANISAYIGQTGFTEQFAIAVLLSWLFGTWLLSRLSRN